MRARQTSNGASRKTTRSRGERAETLRGTASAPPPVETTQSARPARALTASCSRSRKRASPYSAKMAGIAMPASASISASRSAYSIPSRRASRVPTVVLPQPMKPQRMMLFMAFAPSAAGTRPSPRRSFPRRGRKTGCRARSRGRSPPARQASPCRRPP